MAVVFFVIALDVVANVDQIAVAAKAVATNPKTTTSNIYKGTYDRQTA